MSYNIQDGRNKGLLSAVRALDHTNANVDVVVVQEVKISDSKLAANKRSGYSILATAAGTGARC